MRPPGLRVKVSYACQAGNLYLVLLRSIILENHGVYNARAWLPEPNTVFPRRTAEEIVHFRMLTESATHVFLGAFLRDDQMVTVYRRGNRDSWKSRANELQQSHCRRSIVAGYTVRPQF